MRLSPKTSNIITEILRTISAEILSAVTILARKSVKKVKLAMNPKTIPIGLFLELPTDPDKTIGKTGSIHGERTVTTPAKKAKIINKIM